MSILPADIPSDFNLTLLEYPELCTLGTCPLSLANIDYVPSLGGNIFYAAIFCLALIMQILFAIKHKTWGFGIAMTGGLVLEIIGYAARIQMHYNPFLRDPFLMYLVCLTLGPALFSAAICLCLSRIVVVYSEIISRFRPATYTMVFIALDFVALLLQAIGGGIASTANTQSLGDIGKNIMVAGVSWQVASLMVFALLCADFAQKVGKAPKPDLNPVFESFRESVRFTLFLSTLATATLTILIRSVFRCAELSGGFDGKLANQEITFMILEGAMICIAVICLTMLHPGWVFGASWDGASWKIRKTTEQTVETKGKDVVEQVATEP